MRPLHGFGAPTAIRVSVGTPEEHDLFAARARPGARARVSDRRVHAASVRHRRAARCSGTSSFRLLFFATLASGIGNWLAVIALQVDVYDRTHSGWWVGALLIANILPAVFVGLLLGPLVDRLSRKRLMIASDLGRLAVFAALPFVGSAVGDRRARRWSPASATRSSGPAVLAGRAEPRRRRASSPTANALLQLVEWTTTARRPDPRRRARRRLGPGPRLLGERGDVRRLGAARRADPGAAAAERAADRARALARPRARASGRPAQSRALLTVLVAWSIAMLASGGHQRRRDLPRRSSRYDAGDFGFGLLWAAAGIGLVVGGSWARSAAQLVGTSRSAYVRVPCSCSRSGSLGAAVAPNVWVGCRRDGRRRLRERRRGRREHHARPARRARPRARPRVHAAHERQLRRARRRVRRSPAR